MSTLNNDLISYFSKYTNLSEEEIQLIQQQNLIRSFPKSHRLLQEGQLAQECYLVLKGCVRKYYLLDGEEKTTEFYTENQPITPVSYVNKLPSEYYLECLEDCILSAGSEEKTLEAIRQFPKLAAVVSTISNQLMAEQQSSLDDFKRLSPEERYLHVREQRPDLMERIPQYHLASYLGIKPQSLSRIRKRLQEKG